MTNIQSFTAAVSHSDHSMH